jgi:AraC-like DNA-binding protein
MHLSLDFFLLCTGLSVANVAMASLLLFTVKNSSNRKANVVFGIYFLIVGANGLGGILFNNQFFNYFPHLLGYDRFLHLLQGPLLYLYILYQTRHNYRLRPRYLLHLLPLIGYFIFLEHFFTASGAVKIAYLKDLGSVPRLLLANNLTEIQSFSYIIASYYLLLKHDKAIRELASSIEHRTLRWLRTLLLIEVIGYLAWIIFYELNFSRELFSIVGVIKSYWLTYQATNQGYLFANVRTEQVVPILEEAPAVRYRNSTLTGDDVLTYKKQIEQYMSEHKPYLNDDLTLTTLAEQLALNAYHLSQVLNEGFGESFYKFINRYRVEESKRLLLDPAFKHYTILAIANEAGFNSKTTFNKTFKEHFGLSPSEYRKNNLL